MCGDRLVQLPLHRIGHADDLDVVQAEHLWQSMAHKTTAPDEANSDFIHIHRHNTVNFALLDSENITWWHRQIHVEQTT